MWFPSPLRPTLLAAVLLLGCDLCAVHSFKLSTKNSPTRVLPDAERRCVDPIMQKIVWPNPGLLAGFAGEGTCEGVPAWDAPLYYSRIPKTGGTMLRMLIAAVVTRGPERGYGELPVHGWGHGKHRVDATGARVKSALLQVADRSVVARHAGFGMYTPQTAYGLHAIGKTPCCYFTILREPYGRMISWYYEAFRGHPAWGSVDAFLEGCNNSFAMHNLQTLQLCGSAPECADPTRALAIARTNLERCYTVGTLEKLNATIGALSSKFPQYFDPAQPEPPRVRQTSGLEAAPPGVQARVEALRGPYRQVAWADQALWEQYNTLLG